MKKALSLVLAIVMLLSVTTGMSISALAKNEIDDVVIYNITDPVVGNKPDFDYQQYDIAGEFSTLLDKFFKDDEGYKNGIAWYNVTSGKYLGQNDTFKCGNTYKVSVCLSALNGTTFNFDSINATVNGKDASVEEEPGFDGIVARFSAEFVLSDHKWKLDEDYERATLNQDGKKTYTCSKCGAKKSSKISKITSIKLSPSSYTYDGKVKTPKLVVKNSAGTVLSSDYYMLGFDDGRKNVGTYSAEIILRGNYYGVFARTFKINPKGTVISSLTSSKKQQLKVTWAKQATQTTGYQIKYSTTKDFKSSKTLTVSSTKTKSKTISNLKSGKTYYVRVRTYKLKEGTKYYSSWSSYKYKKVK